MNQPKTGQDIPISRYSPSTNGPGAVAESSARSHDHQHSSDHYIRYIGAQFHGCLTPHDYMDNATNTFYHGDANIMNLPELATRKGVTTDFDSRYPHLTSQLDILQSLSSGTITPLGIFNGLGIYLTQEPATDPAENPCTEIALESINFHGLHTPGLSTNQIQGTEAMLETVTHSPQSRYGTAAGQQAKIGEIEVKDGVELGGALKRRRTSRRL
ncbi:hypothetical protein F5Y04DRAFT_282231 [Hypomontagnella monticulosa]|nr:hypothetical protein F5Y04DRAFT_282231 [Hypomontagnella monticulosa]